MSPIHDTCVSPLRENGSRALFNYLARLFRLRLSPGAQIGDGPLPRRVVMVQGSLPFNNHYTRDDVQAHV